MSLNFAKLVANNKRMNVEISILCLQWTHTRRHTRRQTDRQRDIFKRKNQGICIPHYMGRCTNKHTELQTHTHLRARGVRLFLHRTHTPTHARTQAGRQFYQWETKIQKMNAFIRHNYGQKVLIMSINSSSKGSYTFKSVKFRKRLRYFINRFFEQCVEMSINLESGREKLLEFKCLKLGKSLRHSASTFFFHTKRARVHQGCEVMPDKKSTFSVVALATYGRLQRGPG